MNKMLLIGFLSVGLVSFAHADNPNQISSREEEITKTATRFITALERCKAENLTGRKCEARYFKFADLNYGPNTCAVGLGAFDKIYEGTCPKELPHDAEECTLIKQVRKKLELTCQCLSQMKK